MLTKLRISLLLVAILLAGCIGPSPPPANTTPDADPVHVTNNTTVEFISGPSNLEDGENPHGLTVQNRGEATTEIRLYIIREDPEETVFERSYLLDPGAELTGSITYEANYTVAVERGATYEEFDLSRSMFDCNTSGTTFVVTDAKVNSSTFSTMAYCPMDPPNDS